MFLCVLKKRLGRGGHSQLCSEITLYTQVSLLVVFGRPCTEFEKQPGSAIYKETILLPPVLYLCLQTNSYLVKVIALMGFCDLI